MHIFTLYVGLALACGMGLAAFHLRSQAMPRIIGDIFVASLICGFAFARLEYVWLNWDVFSSEMGRIWGAVTGGLDWHGAVAGGVLGAYVASRLHRVEFSCVLDALLPVLPLVAFAGWTACREIGCVYGMEVETLALHPAWMVTEGRDIFGIIAPRYDTHTFGQSLSWLLLVLVALMRLLGRSTFWLIMVLFCVGMIAIGFVRGDYAPQLLTHRADRWLDATLLLISLVMLLWHYRTGQTYNACDTE